MPGAQEWVDYRDWGDCPYCGNPVFADGWLTSRPVRCPNWDSPNRSDCYAHAGCLEDATGDPYVLTFEGVHQSAAEHSWDDIENISTRGRWL